MKKMLITALFFAMQVDASDNSNADNLAALKNQLEQQKTAIDAIQSSIERASKDEAYREEWRRSGGYDSLNMSEEDWVRMKRNDEGGCRIL